MNVGDVKLRVKRKFGDEAQVQITDADIIRWINDGQQFIVSQSDSLLQKAASADIIAGQQEYTLPTDLLVLRNVSMKISSLSPYFPLVGLSLQEFDNLLGGWEADTTNKGIATFYHVYSNTLKLCPIPSTSLTGGLKLYYSRFPVNVSVDTDVIDLPITYHNAIVNYCMQQAYEQDDSSWDAAKLMSDHVLLDVHQNKGRENRNPTGTYGRITVMPEDM